MQAKSLSNRSFKERNDSSVSSSKEKKHESSYKEEAVGESPLSSFTDKSDKSHRSFRPKPVFAGFRSPFGFNKNSPRHLSMDPTPSPKVRPLSRLSEEGPMSPMHHDNADGEALAANRMAVSVLDRRVERRRRAEEARNLNHIHEVKIDATNRKVLKPITYLARGESIKDNEGSAEPLQEFQVREKTINSEQSFVSVNLDQFSSSWEFSSRPEIQKRLYTYMSIFCFFIAYDDVVFLISPMSNSHYFFSHMIHKT